MKKEMKKMNKKLTISQLSDELADFMNERIGMGNYAFDYSFDQGCIFIDMCIEDNIEELSNEEG